jgi:hypothetical protein
LRLPLRRGRSSVNSMRSLSDLMSCPPIDRWRCDARDNRADGNTFEQQCTTKPTLFSARQSCTQCLGAVCRNKQFLTAIARRGAVLMATNYADYIALLATAQELRGKYGSSAPARIWRCARMLRENGDIRSTKICIQLAEITEAMIIE